MMSHLKEISYDRLSAVAGTFYFKMDKLGKMWFMYCCNM